MLATCVRGCRTVSRFLYPRQVAVIPLGRLLLTGSSDLPGSQAGRAAPPPLFGLAPRGVCHAIGITPDAVRSYRTISPLPSTVKNRHSAVYFLLHFPWPVAGPPAVSRHAALRRPDFPPMPVVAGTGNRSARATAHPAASVSNYRIWHCVVCEETPVS